MRLNAALKSKELKNCNAMQGPGQVTGDWIALADQSYQRSFWEAP